MFSVGGQHRFYNWLQPGIISQPTVFFSHNKSAPAGLISPETNQRIGRLSDSHITFLVKED